MLRSIPAAAAATALLAAALAGASSGQPAPGAAPPGLETAIAATQKHGEELLDRPGVAGVGVGVDRNGEPVVEIFKETGDVPGLPRSLEGMPVRFVTTGIIEARAPTDRFPRPVPIGVSAGHYQLATGTLGARVTDGTNVYALSNNHVFAGINTASIGDPILQPGPIEDGGVDPADRIGTLYAYQPIDFNGGDNTMDAAIALTSSSSVGTSTPPDGYGAPSALTAPASIGLPVQKYGRTTGFQLGQVEQVNVSVDVCYLLLFDICLQEARFVNQISISPGPFSAAGDSGSLIVTQSGNQPVALLFAGGDGLTIGTPIDTVLQRFGVTIDGAPPEDGPPGAPIALSALAGDASVSLSWSPPSFDGGSPVTSYRVYRGTSPGSETFLADAGPATSYLDTSAVNGTTYFYKVTAVNANGEGPLSNGASATPTSLVPPAEPLPTVDDFNRANETLSDAGRWTNGVNGSVETGLQVSSNQLACTKTSTCTAWRNTSQYGPDTEVWARLAVKPGDNNQLRLYARLQQVGTSTYDGYMLRPNQLAGTDQVLFERVDNGAIVNLLTVSQELAAGDTFLLRVTGSTIEAWRHDGSGWSRLGTVSDSTYSGAGYAGLGMRGTTGRADDFGARNVGAPPADTEAPGAPASLQASAAGSSQIDLTWLAATDNVGVAQYRIERCQGTGCSSFTEIATTASTSYSDVGLAASTSYSYRVRAEDAAGNQGPYSETASATTAGAPDTEAPSAPASLQASAAGSSQIDLTWLAATDNVGVAQYRIERCQGTGCSSFTEIATTASASYSDAGLAASTSYSYRVRAEDAAGNQGPYSETASATTGAGAVPPVEPLPALDGFDRRNENPLSDQGRWSNGVIGSSETGLRVSSRKLSCTRTTTCTAWRNTSAFGPDTEVWARISTLPGTNNQFRLYARLQQPGSSANDGYMLRTNQLTGTDEVYLERIDNGAIVRLGTFAQDLAVGDVLLFRAAGSALEAWHRRGTTWSLVGSTSDSTYAAAGYIGVGIRGKTGRLDDFGGR